MQDLVAEVMTHWLDRGIDGWRLDAAYAVPPEFWAAVLPRVRQRFPDAWFVGETIHGDDRDYVHRSGLDFGHASCRGFQASTTAMSTGCTRSRKTAWEGDDAIRPQMPESPLQMSDTEHDVWSVRHNAIAVRPPKTAAAVAGPISNATTRMCDA